MDTVKSDEQLLGVYNFGGVEEMLVGLGEFWDLTSVSSVILQVWRRQNCQEFTKVSRQQVTKFRHE